MAKTVQPMDLVRQYNVITHLKDWETNKPVRAMVVVLAHEMNLGPHGELMFFCKTSPSGRAADLVACFQNGCWEQVSSGSVAKIVPGDGSGEMGETTTNSGR